MNELLSVGTGHLTRTTSGLISLALCVGQRDGLENTSAEAKLGMTLPDMSAISCVPVCVCAESGSVGNEMILRVSLPGARLQVLKKIAKYIQEQNDKIYVPRGLLLTDPIERGLRVVSFRTQSAGLLLLLLLWLLLLLLLLCGGCFCGCYGAAVVWGLLFCLHSFQLLPRELSLNQGYGSTMGKEVGGPFGLGVILKILLLQYLLSKVDSKVK